MKAKNLRNLEDRIEEIIGELTDLKLQVIELRQEWTGNKMIVYGF